MGKHGIVIVAPCVAIMDTTSQGATKNNGKSKQKNAHLVKISNKTKTTLSCFLITSDI
jgi:hypothetical protein